MSLQKLREERARIATEMRAMSEKTDWDATTDGAAYQKAVDDLNAIDARITAAIKADEILADNARTQGISDRADQLGRDKGDKGLSLFAKWLKGGDTALTAEDWQTVRNTMSTTTPSEGGFTVQSDVAKSILDAMKAFGGMRQVATVIQTGGGNPIGFPTSNGTSEEGEIVAENQTAADADATFGTINLPVFKYSSKVITVPMELLQDSVIDIAAFVEGRLRTRLGRITNKHFTIGSGSAQPLGVVEAATTGVTATNGTSQATAVKYDSLVNLQHSVDPAYREGGAAGWMFNDNTLRDLRKIVDGQSRPIFVPGYEVSVPGGAPDTLLGSRITINQAMADMAAGAKSILFGDFSYYYIRDVMDVTMFRFTDSAFTKKGQVGFLAWMRSGGALIDVGGAVKRFVNAAS